MQLLLARHGNTFEPDVPPVWIGVRDDRPLVARGRAQAATLADALRRLGMAPVATYCAGLQRTLAYARIVTEALGAAEPIVDERLNELDFGDWSGLTDPQVAARFGAVQLKQWRRESRWPTAGGWGGSETGVREDVRSLTRELLARHAEETVLLVSSNGRLRYFLTLVPGEFERRVAARRFTMRTGHLGKLIFRGGDARVAYWNVDPAAAESL